MMPREPNAYLKVLIVEDEMMLRMRAVDIVEDAGFSPIEATNADDALAILENISDVSLLFTDIQMPGSINGLELAHIVTERWPTIKIILVSGRLILTEADKPIDSLFFGKPLDVKNMIVQMQNLMGESSSRTAASADEYGADASHSSAPPPASLTAENDSLRLLLEQAGVDARALLAEAGLQAKEREASDKLQKLLLEELHHRIKNTLGTVSAIVSQSLRTAASLSHGKEAIEGRLLALGKAHDLLLQTKWANADLAATISAAVDAYDSPGASRIQFNGPEIKVTSAAVIALTLTLNELCTNATKFGALSAPGGSVTLTWKLHEGSDRVELLWTEDNGPRVHTPLRQSFGTRLIRSLGQQLRGEVQLDYRPTGFVYNLNVPLASLVA
jgi:two-component sensor histidine kinase/DNA-binding response OmpR family regulator